MTKLWKESTRYERMAQLEPNYKINSFSKLMLNLHRDRASLLFQLREGHVPLNAYLHKIQKLDSPICSSCWQYSKTVIHFILHCETFKEARSTLFWLAGRDARNLGKILSMKELLPHLFWYIKETGCFSLGNRDIRPT